MSFDPEGYALPAGGGTNVWFLGTRMAVKAGGAETGGAFTFLEWAAPSGFGPPLHRHDAEDEAFYLIDGSIEVTCGDQHWTVGPGGFAFLPRGIPHLFVVSAGPVRGLQVTSPAGFERFIGELGIPAPGPGLPPPAQPDIPRLVEAAARYNQEILGPPAPGVTPGQLPDRIDQVDAEAATCPYAQGPDPGGPWQQPDRCCGNVAGPRRRW